MPAPMTARSESTPVPLEHYAQSVECLICHLRDPGQHYQAFAYRPADTDARRNAMAIVVWICDGCVEGLGSAFAALRVKGPVPR
jgi:hypothetical protein